MCSGVPLPSWQYTTIPCCDSTSDITYLLMFLVSYSLNCIVVFVLHLHQHSSCHQSAQRRTLVDWMFIVVTAQCTCLECTDSICQMSSTYLAFWRELKMLLFKASFRDDQTWSWHVRTYSSCNSHPCFGCWCFMLWRIRNVSLLLLLLLLLIAQLYTWLYAPKVYISYCNSYDACADHIGHNVCGHLQWKIATHVVPYMVCACVACYSMRYTFGA